VTGGLLSTVNDGLERLALGAVIVMMAVMCALTFTQAAGRYALHFSLTWSEELTRFMLVWVSMLGGAVAARRRMHVGFEALTGALPRRLGQTVRVLGLALAIGIFGTMAWYGATLARFNMLQVSAALEWPMGVPYAAIPVGAALFVLFLLEDLVRAASGQERATVPAGSDPGAGSSA
jgi:TRAP-type C4-dicarboxylate transport system permease small subunit